jgi:hypothetical protein
MNDNDASITANPARRPPWNKGKIIGKPPLRQGHVWSIRTRLQLEKRIRDLAFSISRSIASYGAATRWWSASMTWLTAATHPTEPRFDRRRLADLCVSK